MSNQYIKGPLNLRESGLAGVNFLYKVALLYSPICDHALTMPIQIVNVIVFAPVLLGVHTNRLIIQTSVIFLPFQNG